MYYVTQAGLKFITEAGAARLARVQVAKLKRSKATPEAIAQAKRGEYSAAQRMRGAPNPSREDQPHAGLTVTDRDKAISRLRAKQKGIDTIYGRMHKPPQRIGIGNNPPGDLANQRRTLGRPPLPTRSTPVKLRYPKEFVKPTYGKENPYYTGK